jgi:hypothetical protein
MHVDDIAPLITFQFHHPNRPCFTAIGRRQHRLFNLYTALAPALHLTCPCRTKPPCTLLLNTLSLATSARLPPAPRFRERAARTFILVRLHITEHSQAPDHLVPSHASSPACLCGDLFDQHPTC